MKNPKWSTKYPEKVIKKLNPTFFWLFRARRVAEEDCAELEKEKMMIELELTEVSDKNKAALRNLEMLLASSKDTESDLLQRLDSMAKDNDDLVSKVSVFKATTLLVRSLIKIVFVVRRRPLSDRK